MKTLWLIFCFLGLLLFTIEIGKTQGKISLFLVNDMIIIVVNYLNFWLRLEKDTNNFKY